MSYLYVTHFLYVFRLLLCDPTSGGKDYRISLKMCTSNSADNK